MNANEKAEVIHNQKLAKCVCAWITLLVYMGCLLKRRQGANTEDSDARGQTKSWLGFTTCNHDCGDDELAAKLSFLLLLSIRMNDVFVFMNTNWGE